MKEHEFYREYSRLPLDVRDKLLDRVSHGELTMNGVYFQMKELDKELNPLLIKQKELLEIAEEFFPKKK